MSSWGMLLLAGALGVALLGSCGSDETASPGSGVGGSGAAAGSAGKAGSDASAGASGSDAAGGGAGRDAGDSGVQDADGGGAADGDAAVQGCVDIHVTAPALGLFGQRDHLWGDAAGIHMAWNADNGAGLQLAVSTFDPATGTVLDKRLFSTMTVMYASGHGPDGLVAVVGNATDGDGGGYQALLLIRTDDPSYEKLYKLPPWPGAGTDLVGVGWDGQAFTVEGFADDGTVYETRLAEDGTVLLAPEAFGIGTGYASDSRFSTDPASGMTYGLMGGSSLVAHQRDGTPVPDPPQAVPVPLQSSPGGPWSSTTHDLSGTGYALVALPAGLAVAFSSNSPDGENTLIQTLDTSLAHDADTIFVKGKAVKTPWDATAYDWNPWLAIEPLANGWCLAGNPNYRSIDEYVVQGATLASRRTVVTYSQHALATGHGFDTRYFESIEYDGELWLGFQDNSDTDATAVHPYRIIRVKPGCTYRSMTDIEHGW